MAKRRTKRVKKNRTGKKAKSYKYTLKKGRLRYAGRIGR